MAESLKQRCLEGVITTLKSLQLDDIKPGEIEATKFPWPEFNVHRGVYVHADPEVEWRGTNVRDDIGYSFTITLIQGTVKGMSAELDKLSLWRQRIRRAFIHSRLRGVDEVFQCTVHHKTPEMPEKYKNNFDVQQIMIRCWTRESRDTT